MLILAQTTVFTVYLGLPNHYVGLLSARLLLLGATLGFLIFLDCGSYYLSLWLICLRHKSALSSATVVNSSRHKSASSSVISFLVIILAILSRWGGPSESFVLISNESSFRVSV